MVNVNNLFQYNTIKKYFLKISINKYLKLDKIILNYKIKKITSEEEISSLFFNFKYNKSHLLEKQSYYWNVISPSLAIHILLKHWKSIGLLLQTKKC